LLQSLRILKLQPYGIAATRSYAEHQALGGIYDAVFDFKDDIIEKNKWA